MVSTRNVNIDKSILIAITIYTIKNLFFNQDAFVFYQHHLKKPVRNKKRRKIKFYLIGSFSNLQFSNYQSR